MPRDFCGSALGGGGGGVGGGITAGADRSSAGGGGGTVETGSPDSFSSASVVTLIFFLSLHLQVHRFER